MKHKPSGSDQTSNITDKGEEERQIQPDFGVVSDFKLGRKQKKKHQVEYRETKPPENKKKKKLEGGEQLQRTNNHSICLGNNSTNTKRRQTIKTQQPNIT